MQYKAGSGSPGQLLNDFLVTVGPYGHERLDVDSNDEICVYRVHDRNTSSDTINFKGNRYTLTGTGAGAMFDIFLNNITSGYTLRSAAVLSDDTGIRYTTDAWLNSGPQWANQTMSKNAGANYTHGTEDQLQTFVDLSDDIVTLSVSSRNVFLNGSGTAAWTYTSGLSGTVAEIDNSGNIYFWNPTTEEIVKKDWATGTSTTTYSIGETMPTFGANSNQIMDIAGDGTFAVFASNDFTIYKYTFASSNLSAVTTEFVGNSQPRRMKLTQDGTKLCVLSGTYGGSNMRVFSI